MRRMIQLLYIILLWETCDVFAVAQKNTPHLSVWQSPQHLSVMEGANAQITCHFNKSGGRIIVKWEKDNETLPAKQMEYQTITNTSSVLELKSLHQKQSGLYKCKVQFQIPVLKEVEGTGTNVIVTGKTEGSPGLFPGNELILAFGVLFLLVILLISVMVFRRCKRDIQSREDRAESNPQVILQESTSQNTNEITYASINKQLFSFTENQKGLSKEENVRSKTQGQDSTVEEPVLYSAIRKKHVD